MKKEEKKKPTCLVYEGKEKGSLAVMSWIIKKIWMLAWYAEVIFDMYIHYISAIMPIFSSVLNFTYYYCHLIAVDDNVLSLCIHIAISIFRDRDAIVIVISFINNNNNATVIVISFINNNNNATVIVIGFIIIIIIVTIIFFIIIIIIICYLYLRINKFNDNTVWRVSTNHQFMLWENEKATELCWISEEGRKRHHYV